jgi:hypothetical protein
VALLTTTDGTSFSVANIVVPDAPSGGFGLGLAFGTNNSFWGKATGQALRQVSYNPGAGTGSSTRVYADPNFPNTVAPIGISTALNLLGGINVGASNNHFRLYSLTTNNSTPILIATNAFATDNDNTGTGTGAVDFGPDRVYALGANNGIIAMQIIPVAVAPTITQQPQSVSTNAGANVSFSVSATGTAPLSYAWRFNGTNVSGASQNVLSLTNVQSAVAGNYSVLVSNSAGSVTSTDAVLTVFTPPPSQIDSITMLPGGEIVLQVSGAPGHYAIDGSTNLADWSELTNLVTTNSPFEFLDSDIGNAQRFYRARLIP